MARIFDTPIYTGDQSIDRVLNAGFPVVLVFTDGSIPPAMEQVMNRTAKDYAGQLILARVAVKDNPQSVSRFSVHSFPALVTVKAGQAQDRVENATADDLEAHALYLLDRGPRPQPRPQPQGAYAAGGSNGGGRTRPASGGSPGNWQSPAGTSTSNAPAHPVNVTDAGFDQEVMRSAVPVLVDFWAEWCGPCRMMEPVLDKLAREMSGRLKIAKVNVDENPMAPGRYGVQAIPTMLLVKGGQVLDRWSGALPEAALRSRLARVL